MYVVMALGLSKIHQIGFTLRPAQGVKRADLFGVSGARTGTDGLGREFPVGCRLAAGGDARTRRVGSAAWEVPASTGSSLFKSRRGTAGGDPSGHCSSCPLGPPVPPWAVIRHGSVVPRRRGHAVRPEFEVRRRPDNRGGSDMSHGGHDGGLELCCPICRSGGNLATVAVEMSAGTHSVRLTGAGGGVILGERRAGGRRLRAYEVEAIGLTGSSVSRLAGDLTPTPPAFGVTILTGVAVASAIFLIVTSFRRTLPVAAEHGLLALVAVVLGIIFGALALDRHQVRNVTLAHYGDLRFCRSCGVVFDPGFGLLGAQQAVRPAEAWTTAVGNVRATMADASQGHIARLVRFAATGYRWIRAHVEHGLSKRPGGSGLTRESAR